jgi:hypothetical protein
MNFEKHLLAWVWDTTLDTHISHIIIKYRQYIDTRYIKFTFEIKIIIIHST